LAQVSKKKYIYTIDDDCFVAKTPSGEDINALEQHIRNLLTPSTPLFFNTLYDPYAAGADFVRGYPFSLREGCPTAISHGAPPQDSARDELVPVLGSSRASAATAKPGGDASGPCGGCLSVLLEMRASGGSAGEHHSPRPGSWTACAWQRAYARPPLATSPASRRGTLLPQGRVEEPRPRSHPLPCTMVRRGSAARGRAQLLELTGAACARAGLWLNIPDYDAPTQMVKPLERNTRYVDAVLTIPKARRVAAQHPAPPGWHARVRSHGCSASGCARGWTRLPTLAACARGLWAGGLLGLSPVAVRPHRAFCHNLPDYHSPAPAGHISAYKPT